MRLVEFTESPRTFHGRDIPSDSEPELWWNHVTEPALVLGSTQRDESIVALDVCAAEGVDVVRRRSGGGAVLLVPGEVVWFDVVIPNGRVPGLGGDVHAPMLWLGRHLAGIVGPLLSGEVRVSGPAMITTAWSNLICFDGFGPGEVLLDGRKLVGISQRRTRAAARLQCCWYRSYDPTHLPRLLAPTARPPLDELSSVATADIDPRPVLEALARTLTPEFVPPTR